MSIREKAQVLLRVGWALLKHPVTGVAAALVIGVVAYFAGHVSKEPYYATGAAEPVARALAPRLKILWDGSEVPNVMSARVAFWNAGSQYIDAKDISESEPIRFIPSANVQILGAEIVRSGRTTLSFASLVKFDPILNKNVVEVRIVGDEALERGDGGLFRVLFAGDADVTFTVTGRIKGAPDGFKRKEWSDLTQKPILPAVMSVLALFYGGISVRLFSRAIRTWREGVRDRWVYLALSVALVTLAVSLGMSVYLSARAWQSVGIPGWLR